MEDLWLTEDGWDSSPLAAPPTLGKPPRAPPSARILRPALTPLTRALRSTDRAFRTGTIGDDGDGDGAADARPGAPAQAASTQRPHLSFTPAATARSNPSRVATTRSKPNAHTPHAAAATSPQLHATPGPLAHELDDLSWLDAEATYDWGSPGPSSATQVSNSSPSSLSRLSTSAASMHAYTTSLTPLSGEFLLLAAGCWKPQHTHEDLRWSDDDAEEHAMRSSSSARRSVGGQPANASERPTTPPPPSQPAAQTPSLSASPVSVRSQCSRRSAPPSPAIASLAHQARLPPPAAAAAVLSSPQCVCSNLSLPPDSESLCSYAHAHAHTSRRLARWTFRVRASTVDDANCSSKSRWLSS
jgi:hypothetical protein